MKKILTAILTLLCAANIFAAENYPYRSDFLWVTNPNHADWLYKTGENATVEVQLYEYGCPVTTEAEYEICPDMLPATSKGKVSIKNGKASINMGTRKTPGFQDLKLTAVVNGKKTQHHIKVGFSVNDIMPYTKMPKQFKSFWDNTIAEARKTPLNVTREYSKELSNDIADCWLIKLQIDRTHYMYGYLSIPKKGGEKMPVSFCPPGAGVKTIKEPLRRSYYAEQGIIRLEAEIHGIDPRTPENTFKEIRSAFGSGGYLSIQLDNRDNYYMRHIYAGMVRWIDFLCSLPEWNGKDVFVQGGSQGGALALVTAALDPRVTACCVNHPALTDMAGYADNGRTGGYPHFTKEQLTPQVIENLEYYDIINFCRIVECPVRMTWGYNDPTCPPTTSYAAWNTLKCPKEMVLTPVNEHWTSSNMEREHMEWQWSKRK